MNNENALFLNLKDRLNISPNTSSNFDSMYNNEDILTYSESQSQSVIYINNKNFNNDHLLKNKNQSLKNILLNKEESKNDNNINSDNYIKDSELSELQISLSNLISESESKDNIFLNEYKNIYNIQNIIQKKEVLNNNQNYFIDISNEVSNTNEIEIENNKIKDNKNQNDEQSSVCNYSNSLYNSNSKNKQNINYEKILFISPNKKRKYQIEKGENISLSLSNNNKINNFQKTLFINDSNYDKTLSISKAHNFTINNNITENNDNYNFTESIYNVKEKKEKLGDNKNKIKLINNKNIDVNKDDMKKFFYNPKKNVHTKILKRNNNELKNNHKKERKVITEINNKTNFNIKDENINKTDYKKTKNGFNKIIHMENNSQNNENDKGNLILKKKKLFYLNKNKNKNNTNIKERYKTINNCITEPSKIKKMKLNDIISKDLMQKLKTEQNKTKNKLLNRLNDMNSNTINNQKTQDINFLPIFTKAFENKNKKKKKEQSNNLNQKENENKQKEYNSEEMNKIKDNDLNKYNKTNTNNNDISNESNAHKKISLVSLLNNFNIQKNKKNHKSLFNFGNIFFINQNENQGHKKADTEIFMKNNIKMKQKHQIITDFSNYKKKIKSHNSKNKRINTDIDVYNIKKKFKNVLKIKS